MELVWKLATGQHLRWQSSRRLKWCALAGRYIPTSSADNQRVRKTISRTRQSRLSPKERTEQKMATFDGACLWHFVLRAQWLTTEILFLSSVQPWFETHDWNRFFIFFSRPAGGIRSPAGSEFCLQTLQCVPGTRIRSRAGVGAPQSLQDSPPVCKVHNRRGRLV